MTWYVAREAVKVDNELDLGEWCWLADYLEHPPMPVMQVVPGNCAQSAFVEQPGKQALMSASWTGTHLFARPRGFVPQLALVVQDVVHQPVLLAVPVHTALSQSALAVQAAPTTRFVDEDPPAQMEPVPLISLVQAVPGKSLQSSFVVQPGKQIRPSASVSVQ